ncbi:MAG: OmpA family protein [Deltaproteobacteria bacterium]|nr:OmpA family protein [Deltaproteobacteria bacterium]
MRSLSLFCFSVGLAASSAWAEDASLPAERLRLATDVGGLFDVEGAVIARHLDFDVAGHIGYALNPLVLYVDGQRSDALVAHRLGGNVVAAVALFDWVQLGVDVPVVFLQLRDQEALTDNLTSLAQPSAIGFGDLRVVPKLRILRAADAVVDLAFALPATLPTGFPGASYLGEGGVTVSPELLAGLPLGKTLRLAGNLGVKLRGPRVVNDLALDQELTWRAGVAHVFTQLPAPLELGLTANGGTLLLQPFSSGTNENPVEAALSLGVDINKGLRFTGYAGAGIVGGYGVPDLRVGALVRYSPRDRDQDDDLVDDDKDACVDQPEDRDGFDDADGCPDLDDDKDGVLDTADRCPRIPEDVDGFQDSDGCVDADDDKDAVLDLDDACPRQFGLPALKGCPRADRDDDGIVDDDDQCPDVKGPAHTRGCPDGDGDGIVDDQDACPAVPGLPIFKGCADGDKDGIADPDDKCPTEPETINGVDDDDGCPDKGKTHVKLTTEKVEILQKVFFDVDKASIQPRSFPLLKEVALVLRSHPELKRWRVEGHTDSDGNDLYNLELSQLRADSVKLKLIEFGVPVETLEARGYGESRPVGNNKKPAGREQNRRVEFVLVPTEPQP